MFTQLVHQRTKMALVVKAHMEFSSDKPEIHTTGFETIYLEEPEDESSISSRNEELREGSFPQISSVESIDPSQFLQEEMFVEEERFVSWSFIKRKQYCFIKKFSWHSLLL
jgi:hypothetical protein